MALAARPAVTAAFEALAAFAATGLASASFGVTVFEAAALAAAALAGAFGAADLAAALGAATLEAGAFAATGLAANGQAVRQHDAGAQLGLGADPVGDGVAVDPAFLLPDVIGAFAHVLLADLHESISTPSWDRWMRAGG